MEDIELKKHPETGELIEEEWKVIPECGGYYEISNYGRVKSWYNNKWGKSKKPKLLNPYTGNRGYLKIVTCYNSNRKHRLVHRLVASAFISNPNNKPCINHKDGDKLNPFFLNLEWTTRVENNKHAWENGLINNRGENCGTSKITREEVFEIKELYDTGDYYQREIGEIYGITQSQVSHILNNKTWKHI